MRVLYYVPHLGQRVEHFVQAFAQDNDVRLVNSSHCWLPRKKIGTGFFSDTELAGSIESVTVQPLFPARHGSVRLLASWTRLLRAGWSYQRPDVVIGYNPTLYAGLPAWCVARFRGVPFVLDYADLVAVGDTAHRMRAAVERFLVRQASRVVVLSRAWAEVLSSEFGVPAERVSVVPNGVDAEIFGRVDISREEAAELFGISAGERVVVYTGSTWYRRLAGRGRIDIQGVESLLRAVENLAENGMPVTLLLLGPRREDLPTWTARCASRIIWGGAYRTGDKRHAAAFAIADCLALPAERCITYDYFDRFKFYEYMMSRAPIVAPDTPIVREVYGPIDGVVYYECGSVQDLAAKVAIALEDPHLRARSAARRMPNAYLWTERATAMVEVVGEAASRARLNVQ